MKIEKPLSKEDIENGGTLPAGTYPFSVIKAERGVSKKGNDMIKLNLRLYGAERDAFCTDYLLETMPFKLGQFCTLTGLEDRYNAGELEAEDCMGREGYVTVKRTKDDYGVKNEVKDYVPEPRERPDKETVDARRKELATGLAAAGTTTLDEDSEIPF